MSEVGGWKAFCKIGMKPASIYINTNTNTKAALADMLHVSSVVKG